TLESDPGTGTVSFTVRVETTVDGIHQMVLTNVKNPANGPFTYPVDSIYGGGVKKQRFMTELSNPSGRFLAMLPLQFQHDGADPAPYGRTSKVWRDYNGYKWYDEAAQTFKTPAAKDSFEKNCISCHAVGVRITGSDATVWTAETVKDFLYGDFDYDGDGIREEMNVGCESCHGPGSRHWEEAGQGRHIVSLSLLTPEREAMVCGQCHSRPKGALNTDSPVDADGWMMRAGTSRNDFLTFHATSQLDGAASDYYADPDKHSKSHHQQYSDFIRSGLYKNATQLMTCSSCHDPHRMTAARRQLRADPDSNAALCGSCHEGEATNLSGHIEAVKPGLGFHSDQGIKCTDCHMPRTAKTGSGVPGAVIASVQYWQNDVTSHLFVVPGKVNSSKAAGGLDMPTGYTKACGACHTTVPAP
ncbi:MAG TPA: cytochrome c3 family protein, partial [Anaeromyxobacteraceae bacterium]|nr:cytochrome c3 family protein [Anaeromyxobacteraceae bacterium]